MLSNEFLSVIPKPKSSAHTAASWKRVEQTLTTPLPADYKSFVESYGNGLICGVIRIHNPFSGYMDWFDTILDMYRGMKDIFSHPLFPTSGGLLPFGYTENGGMHLMWKTSGSTPDKWTVALVNWDKLTVESLDYNMTDFLLNVARGQITGDQLNYADSLDYQNLFRSDFV